MIKIAWCNDFKDAGGAEITSNLLIPKSPFNIGYMNAEIFNSNYDYYILNNVRTFTKEQLKYISQKKKYILFWHDVIGHCFSFEIKTTKEIISNANYNIFLSPLHHKQVQKKYNLSIIKYQYQLPFIDINIFNDLNSIRLDKVCWVGSIYPHKGIENCLMWGKENNKKIDFYGIGDPLLIYQIKESNYGEYCGDIKYEFVNEVYKKYKYFIHLPSDIEACGRSVMEAYFSGCQMITNNNVGFYSYGYNFDNKDEIKNLVNDSYKIFWSAIKNGFNL